jgi:hypothetical protein
MEVTRQGEVSMTRRLLLPAFITAGVSTLAYAQSDANPAHSPDVFLDNHRPLIQKKQKNPTARTVTGKVVDDTGQPLDGAAVTLTDTKTNEKTTVFTKKDGRYTFEDLSFTKDYDLQARYKSQLSDERKLSQYDHSANVVRILTVGENGGSADANKQAVRASKK